MGHQSRKHLLPNAIGSKAAQTGLEKGVQERRRKRMGGGSSEQSPKKTVDTSPTFSVPQSVVTLPPRSSLNISKRNILCTL